MAVGLARATERQGPILDVGSHAGFIGAVLSECLEVEVVGIDPSKDAISFGSSCLPKTSRLSLVNAAIPWKTDSRFDMIVSIDTLPKKSQMMRGFLQGLSYLLKSGGLAIISSAYWVDCDIALMRRNLRAARFGFGYADVVGGYGSIPLQFEATCVLVFVKDGKQELPRNFQELAESEWPAFREYSNNPSTRNTEKTQAYERAQRRSLS
jgi:hypothetical protein